MIYGVCGDPGQAALLRDAGFDYLEINVQRDLMPAQGEAVFAPVRDALLAAPLPCRAANCLLPPSLRLTGPGPLPPANQYLQTAFRRAVQVGIDRIVFGSGGARQIPDGFDRRAAWKQLTAFGRLAGDLAADAGLQVLVEPLCRLECNVLNSLLEAAELVDDIDRPAVGLLLDTYHWGLEKESVADLAALAGRIRHMHVATVPSRRPPGGEPCDFSALFAILRGAGYDGGISIESGWQDLGSEAAPALRVLEGWVHGPDARPTEGSEAR